MRGATVGSRQRFIRHLRCSAAPVAVLALVRGQWGSAERLEGGWRIFWQRVADAGLASTRDPEWRILQEVVLHSWGGEGTDRPAGVEVLQALPVTLAYPLALRIVSGWDYARIAEHLAGLRLILPEGDRDEGRGPPDPDSAGARWVDWSPWLEKTDRAAAVARLIAFARAAVARKLRRRSSRAGMGSTYHPCLSWETSRAVAIDPCDSVPFEAGWAEHRPDCVACREWVERHQAVDEVLRNGLDRVRPDGRFVWDVVRNVDWDADGGRSLRRRAVRRSLSVHAAALLLALLGVGPVAARAFVSPAPRPTFEARRIPVPLPELPTAVPIPDREGYGEEESERAIPVGPLLTAEGIRPDLQEDRVPTPERVVPDSFRPPFLVDRRVRPARGGDPVADVREVPVRRPRAVPAPAAEGNWEEGGALVRRGPAVEPRPGRRREEPDDVPAARHVADLWRREAYKLAREMASGGGALCGVGDAVAFAGGPMHDRIAERVAEALGITPAQARSAFDVRPAGTARHHDLGAASWYWLRHRPVDEAAWWKRAGRDVRVRLILGLYVDRRCAAGPVEERFCDRCSGRGHILEGGSMIVGFRRGECTRCLGAGDTGRLAYR